VKVLWRVPQGLESERLDELIECGHAGDTSLRRLTCTGHRVLAD